MVTINGPVTWTSGFMDEAGTTVANGGLLLNPVNGGNVQIRFGRVFNNAAAATWTNGNTSFYLVNDSTFNNLAGATFTASSAGLLQMFGTGGIDNFNNAGTYTKAGAGTNHLTVIFNNSNAVNVTAGRLDLSGGGTQTGTIQVQARWNSAAALTESLAAEAWL
jgi:hypothetical protein